MPCEFSAETGPLCRLLGSFCPGVQVPLLQYRVSIKLLSICCLVAMVRGDDRYRGGNRGDSKAGMDSARLPAFGRMVLDRRRFNVFFGQELRTIADREKDHKT